MCGKMVSMLLKPEARHNWSTVISLSLESEETQLSCACKGEILRDREFGSVFVLSESSVWSG